MVGPAMTRRTVWTGAVAAFALAFLIVMTVTGALPRQRHFVKFEANGVLQLPPERISSIALHAGERAAILLRSPDGSWARDDGTPLPADVGKRVALAVQFMNTSAPVRVIGAPELREFKPSEFGLDRPLVSIALFEGSRPILSAHFGARNPDGYLQYVRLDGRPELLLLSRFVGAEWEAVAQAMLAP